MSAGRTRGVVSTALALGALCLALPGCGSAVAGPPAAPTTTTTASFAGHGSVGEAYVTGAPAGAHLVLADNAGREVGRGIADGYGSLIVRGLAPGSGYSFRAVTAHGVAGTRPFRVLSLADVPPQRFYASQHLHEGLNYLVMRDGVELAATLRLPPGKSLDDGPFPTVIEESGYAIAAPGDLLAAELDPLKIGIDQALLPDTATAVGSVIAPLLGFATVSLQMRGSGCSGGAFGLFDLPTTADGYDATEIVAAQPFVKGHKVGMVGISFSGISQLFVAGTRPPHLAAIAPMSVTDDLYSTGYPGGIFNDGFAGTWIRQRVTDAQPAPQGGQEYARALIARGDRQCLADQRLRLQTQDVETLIAANSHRTPSLFDVRSPAAWAAKIDVPVFLVGQFQDEQTGGQWPALLGALAHDPRVWVTMQNGTHTDSLSPDTLSRWIEFLHLFVAGDLPSAPPGLGLLAGTLFRTTTGAAASPLPALRYTHAASLAAAQRGFEADPRVRVLFDNGGGPAPGGLGAQWQEGYPSWPPPAVVPTRYYLGPGGSLTTSVAGSGAVSFRPDPAARPRTDLPTGSVADALPPYDWTPVPAGAGIGFVSPTLDRDVAAVGPASMDLWVRSSAADTDLQVTVSDVLPNGQEMFVQSGVLRASDRRLDRAASTALLPVPTYLARDAAPLPAGRYSLVRVPVLPFAHVFRAGDRIRVVVGAPGGDRPAWAFATPPTDGRVVDTVSLGGSAPSALVLPVVPGLFAPDATPGCPSLRGEPCRAYVAADNGG